MAFNKILKGLDANLANAEIVDGTFHYTTDKTKLYVDDGNTRVLLNPNADQNATTGNAVVKNKPTKLSDFIDDIGAGGGGSGVSGGTMTFQDITVTSVTATSDYTSFAYVYTYSQPGVTEDDYVFGTFLNNDYNASYAVESGDDEVYILFASQPTTPIDIRVYRFDTSIAFGMTCVERSITSVSASSTYTQYSYSYFISLSNVSADSYVDLEILNDTYTGSVAVESVAGGVYIYFASQPTTFPINVKLFIYTSVVNTTNSISKLMYTTYNVTAVTADNTYSGYPYVCSINYLGVSSATQVDISIDKTDFDGNYGIESGTNTLKIYFSKQPTLPLTAEIWIQNPITV